MPLTLLALSALIVAAGVGARQYLSKDAQAAYRTATVEIGNLDKIVTAVGSLFAVGGAFVGSAIGALTGLAARRPAAEKATQA